MPTTLNNTRLETVARVVIVYVYRSDNITRIATMNDFWVINDKAKNTSKKKTINHHIIDRLDTFCHYS
jgi:hypothetical protein